MNPENPLENSSSIEKREKLHDPYFLPTHEDISQAFQTNGAFSMDYYNFCFDENNPVFELLNEEFIVAFTNYLTERLESLNVSDDAPAVILEVGAGNGRLSHFLRQRLEAKLPGKTSVVATDSGEFDIKKVFPVENIGHKEALEKYKPRIVIFSWMPKGVDLTDDFRATDSIEEYILIKETDGCCGDEWLTWGERNDDKSGNPAEIPPFIRNGFFRNNLNEISIHQKMLV